MLETVSWAKLEQVWAESPNIIAVWVFGSAQRGEVTTGSDVDIGVLFAQLPSIDEQLILLGKLQSALEFDKVDLVILNTVNPILGFEAISGKSLFCRNINHRADFVSLTAREYEDEMALWQRMLR